MKHQIEKPLPHPFTSLCVSCPSILRQEEAGPNMGIRRPIEFAHISLPYGFTTMRILETGAISSKRAGSHTHTYSWWPHTI